MTHKITGGRNPPILATVQKEVPAGVSNKSKQTATTAKSRQTTTATKPGKISVVAVANRGS